MPSTLLHASPTIVSLIICVYLWHIAVLEVLDSPRCVLQLHWNCVVVLLLTMPQTAIKLKKHPCQFLSKHALRWKPLHDCWKLALFFSLLFFSCNTLCSVQVAPYEVGKDMFTCFCSYYLHITNEITLNASAISWWLIQTSGSAMIITLI